MQYLLTEDEYNDLHGEGDEETQALAIENIKLKSQLDSIIKAIGQAPITSYAKAEELGEKYVAIELMVRTLPNVLRPLIAAKTPKQS